MLNLERFALGYQRLHIVLSDALIPLSQHRP